MLQLGCWFLKKHDIKLITYCTLILGTDMVTVFKIPTAGRTCSLLVDCLTKNRYTALLDRLALALSSAPAWARVTYFARC